MLKTLAFIQNQDAREVYAYSFPVQECNLVAVLVWLNLALLLKKLCKVHMKVFEIVAHHNVDN